MNNLKLVDQRVCCLLNFLQSAQSNMIVKVLLSTNTKKPVCVETWFYDAKPSDV